MNQFSIRDIENLCGIKAHTLRIWEQRYQLFTPRRKESSHRTYDCDDLRELLRISFLYHHGYKISRIAAMNPAEIQEEIEKIKPQPCNYEIFVHQLTEASISFDKASFEKVCSTLLTRIGGEDAMLHVFYPFLQRIGLLWMTNHVIPAQEHFSSNLIRKKIMSLTDRLPPITDKTKNVIVFSPPGELHEIPLLVVNYLLRKRGVRTTYFGTNVNTASLQYYTGCHPVTHLYCHVITHLDAEKLNEFICSVCHVFPGQQIIISGPASTCIRQQPVNLTHLRSLEEVIGFVNDMVSEKNSTV